MHHFLISLSGAAVCATHVKMLNRVFPSYPELIVMSNFIFVDLMRHLYPFNLMKCSLRNDDQQWLRFQHISQECPECHSTLQFLTIIGFETSIKLCPVVSSQWTDENLKVSQVLLLWIPTLYAGVWNVYISAFWSRRFRANMGKSWSFHFSRINWSDRGNLAHIYTQSRFIESFKTAWIIDIFSCFEPFSNESKKSKRKPQHNLLSWNDLFVLNSYYGWWEIDL